MADEFLDTNVILRFVLQDHPEHTARANRLMAELAAGGRSIATSEAVIVELVQVLSSKSLYSFPRADIRRHLAAIIELPGLEILHKATYLRALDHYVTMNVDFVDALNVAHMEREGIRIVVSFDRDFDKVTGITRREP